MSKDQPPAVIPDRRSFGAARPSFPCQPDAGRRERSEPPASPFGNQILDSLSASFADASAAAVLRRTIVQAGHTIGQAGSPLEKVYFPETALISAVVEFSSGESIDGVLIGSEGVFGASAAFGVKAPLYSSIVQRAGTCWVMPASELRRLIKANDAVRSLLFRYQHFLVAQAQQNVACAARHEIRERMCGYLLRVRDDRGEIRLTQEHLARTLGVRRTSVSTVAGTLQRDGIISNQRGRIRILDPGRLRSIACECHHAIETFKRSLIEPPVSI